MKKVIILFVSAIILGIMFTFLFLNKKDTYAKEKYMIFAFQTGAFNSEENAINHGKNLPSSIIVKDDNLYRVYIAMYKNIDIVNKMLVYFENNNINVYLKNINVEKDFYDLIDQYESLIVNSENAQISNKVNQSILNLYQEEEKHDKTN